jgi:hypothetical protein
MLVVICILATFFPLLGGVAFHLHQANGERLKKAYMAYKANDPFVDVKDSTLSTDTK